MGTEGDFLEVNYKRIAHNIKNLRKHYHMTQAQLAEIYMATQENVSMHISNFIRMANLMKA